jgi:dihydrofolate synthase/folylpolyglutamate synthase
VGGQLVSVRGLVTTYDQLLLPFFGDHQAENAAVAVAAVETFLGGGTQELTGDVLDEGFAAATSPGRLQLIGQSPRTIVDAAHNPHGAAALAAALSQEFSFSKLVGVLAVMADKDARGILQALADSFDEVVVTRNSSPRSMPVAELADLAVDIFGEEKVHVADRMDEAIALAVDLVEADAYDVAGTGVIITGSVVSAGDGRSLTGLAPA